MPAMRAWRAMYYLPPQIERSKLLSDRMSCAAEPRGSPQNVALRL